MQSFLSSIRKQVVHAVVGNRKEKEIPIVEYIRISLAGSIFKEILHLVVKHLGNQRIDILLFCDAEISSQIFYGSLKKCVV